MRKRIRKFLWGYYYHGMYKSFIEKQHTAIQFPMMAVLEFEVKQIFIQQGKVKAEDKLLLKMIQISLILGIKPSQTTEKQ